MVDQERRWSLYNTATPRFRHSEEGCPASTAQMLAHPLNGDGLCADPTAAASA
jgi:hypothetical protein